jgi:hypothetical protein
VVFCLVWVGKREVVKDDEMGMVVGDANLWLLLFSQLRTGFVCVFLEEGTDG